MYRITRTMTWVMNRLRGFAQNPEAPVRLEAAERFLLTFALMEKLIRRTLTELIQTREGALAGEVIAERQRHITWGDIDGIWRRNDPNGRRLSTVLGNNGEFRQIQAWSRMRNALVHGNVQRYGQEYDNELPRMIAMVELIRARFRAEYHYYGWRGSQFR